MLQVKQVDIPLDSIKEILELYNIDHLKHKPLTQGMDNVNIKITDKTNRLFVLKLCSAPISVVKAHLKIIHQVGTKEQQPLINTAKKQIFTHRNKVGYLLPYIKGEDHTGKKLTQEEIKKIATFYRTSAKKIEKCKLKPKPIAWVLSEFYETHQEYKKYLPQNPIPTIDLKKEKKVLCHNDFSRSNLLIQNKTGNYHLLDFGDTAHTHKISCLAVAIAHFCVENTKKSDVLPHVATFISQQGYTPNLTNLYHLIRLRFIQAITLSQQELDLNGFHPRNKYWTDFGVCGLATYDQIPIDTFVHKIKTLLEQ